MKLYLLRHGRADWPEWTAPDDERPLTDEGIQEMQRVATALKRLKLNPDHILSSPLPRALKTAEITGKALGIKVQERPELKPGFDRRKCDALLAAFPGDDLLLAGHEPDFSRIVRSYTGGRVKFPKAALAAIEIGEELPAPRLLFFFPAKALVRFVP